MSRLVQKKSELCSKEDAYSTSSCSSTKHTLRISNAKSGCEHMGLLPHSDSGNLYILVAGDYFTRWMEAYPIPNQEATTVARVLVDKIFCRFSSPSSCTLTKAGNLRQ